MARKNKEAPVVELTFIDKKNWLLFVARFFHLPGL
jgi:hypothetical protein